MASPQQFPDLVSRAEFLQRQAESREAVRRRHHRLLEENEAIRLANRQLEDKHNRQTQQLRRIFVALLFAMAAIVGLICALLSNAGGLAQ